MTSYLGARSLLQPLSGHPTTLGGRKLQRIAVAPLTFGGVRLVVWTHESGFVFVSTWLTVALLVGAVWGLVDLIVHVYRGIWGRVDRIRRG